LFPWTCLIQFESDVANVKLTELSAAAGDVLAAGQAETDVWSYSSPLGRRSVVGPKLAALLAPGSLANYWNPTMRTLRFEVMAPGAPFSPAALTEFRRDLAGVSALLAERK